MGNNQDWRLAGSDYEFAKRMFSYDGCICFSTAYREGGCIRIASGLLKDMDGMISRIDAHGQVTVKSNDREVNLRLWFDFIEKPFDIGRRCTFEKKSTQLTALDVHRWPAGYNCGSAYFVKINIGIILGKFQPAFSTTPHNYRSLLLYTVLT